MHARPLIALLACALLTSTFAIAVAGCAAGAAGTPMDQTGDTDERTMMSATFHFGKDDVGTRAESVVINGVCLVLDGDVGFSYQTDSYGESGPGEDGAYDLIWTMPIAVKNASRSDGMTDITATIHGFAVEDEYDPGHIMFADVAAGNPAKLAQDGEGNSIEGVIAEYSESLLAAGTQAATLDWIFFDSGHDQWFSKGDTGEVLPQPDDVYFLPPVQNNDEDYWTFSVTVTWYPAS
ncbi:MAG: hypothetical protein GF320_18290 [Armatimonadia bacterium]|nr:hypothetical protein [Armatimonadia bacterium]